MLETILDAGNDRQCRKRVGREQNFEMIQSQGRMYRFPGSLVEIDGRYARQETEAEGR